MNELNFDEKSKINELLEYVYDYNRLCLNKDDFIKRKRVKNSIPCVNRCNARRANGEQCTRRRRDDCEYCGTHEKGIPHGRIEEKTNENSKEKEEEMLVEVYLEDQQGIMVYRDKEGRTYDAIDIIRNKRCVGSKDIWKK
jgi:hypothetical protein